VHPDRPSAAGSEAAQRPHATRHVGQSYHYETLPGPLGGTEVLVVDDVADTNVRPTGGAGWQFVAQLCEDVPPGTEATFRAVHKQALAAFTDDAFDDDAQPWSSRDIADRVMTGGPDQDSLAIRMLAGRIATNPTPSPADPLHTLKDFGRALGAITSATSSMITSWLDVDDLEPEQVDEYRKTVQSLIAAAKGLDKLSGWF